MSELEFSPIKITPYLTIVEGRKPKQKTHTTLGNAKNAFDTPRFNPLVEGYNGRKGAHTHGWGGLYQYTGTEWKLIYEVPQPTESDKLEGKRNFSDRYETRPWRTE